MTGDERDGTVWILVGPKGAGKSFVGALLERERGISFLRVEPIFLDVIARARAKNDEVFARGFETVAERVGARLEQTDELVIESTATWHRFGEFLDSLRARHHVRLVRVEAPAEQCIARVQTRDASVHIPVSDADLRRINEAARAVEIPVDGTLENADATSEATLLHDWDEIGARPVPQ